MTYTKEQFLDDVKAEAKALREHATKEELGSLNFDTLDSRSYKNCIYGQCTGDCFNLRASQLIFACCPKYFRTEDEEDNSAESLSIRRDNSYEILVNGEKPENVTTETGLHNHRAKKAYFHYSAIETYIMQPWAQNANLIAYLRGETDDLNL